MAKSVNEQLSAFVDGELSLEEQQQLINRMCHDETLKRAWEQYHAIGDSLRGGISEKMPVDFAQSVMSAIESEPLILAPNSRTQELSQDTTRQHVKPNSFGRRVAGFAIAASVATAAVVGLQLQTQTADELSLQQVAQAPADNDYERMPAAVGQSATFQSKIPAPTLASQIPLAQSIQQQNQAAQLVELQRNQNARVIMNGVDLVDGTFDTGHSVVMNDQLHKYLVNHNQNVAGSRIVGFMPYARIMASNQSGGIEIKDTQQGQQ